MIIILSLHGLILTLVVKTTVRENEDVKSLIQIQTQCNVPIKLRHVLSSGAK